MTGRDRAATRRHYLRFTPVGLRWNDHDVFGHVNNAEYYAFFDTAVVRFLFESGEIDLTGGALGMVVAESRCRYHSEITFADVVEVGLRVAHIGRSSVRYDIGVFKNDDDQAAAEGFFVHVFVDRQTKRPTGIPSRLRAHFQTIAMPEEQPSV